MLSRYDMYLTYLLPSTFIFIMLVWVIEKLKIIRKNLPYKFISCTLK